MFFLKWQNRISIPDVLMADEFFFWKLVIIENKKTYFGPSSVIAKNAVEALRKVMRAPVSSFHSDLNKKDIKVLSKVKLTEKQVALINAKML